MSDIQQLRKRQLFQPIEDISGMQMNYGMESMGYQSAPPPIQEDVLPPKRGPLEMIGSNPTFPTQNEVMPRQEQIDPTKTPAGAAPLRDPNSRNSLEDTINAINRVYTPETTDRDRMRGLLDAAPERQPPSFARAMVAGGLSLKAQDPVATSEAVMYAPHRRNMADWTAKAEPFYKAAELENRGNINERTLAGNVVTAQTQADRLAENARQADLKNEQSLGRNKIAMLKAQMGQGWKLDARNGTTIKVINSATGEVKDTGMSTRWMDEADKVDAEGEWNVKAAKARGEAAEATTAIRGRILTQDSKGNQFLFDPATKSIEPLGDSPDMPEGGLSRVGTQSQNTPRTGAGTKPNTLETRRQEQDKFQDLFERDAEARKQIIRNGNGTFRMRERPQVGPSGVFGWGAGIKQEDVDAWDEVKRSIDPTYVPPSTTTPKTSGVGPTGTTNKPSAGTGIGPSEKTASEIFQPWLHSEKTETETSEPPTPKGRIAVYDKNGNLVGHISDTPEMRAEAAKHGHYPRK